jgi:hypothetical protein
MRGKRRWLRKFWGKKEGILNYEILRLMPKY